MENLEPKKERSPIESLKFQRKSDYKKFRNFIKKETKELKGIVRPKEDKLKSILKVSAAGLGIAGLAGIITKGLAAKEGDDFERTFEPGVYGIGKRNFPTKFSGSASPVPRASSRILYPTRGTNANPKVKITQSSIQRQTIQEKLSEKVKVKQAERSVTLNESRNRRSNIKKRKVRLKKAELSGNTLANKTTSSGVTDRPDKTSVRKFRDNISKTLRNKKISNVGGGFDLSDPDFIKDMDEVTKELYKLENLKKKGIKPNQFFDGQDLEVERVILDAQQDPGLKKLDNIDKGLDNLLDKINKSDDKPLPSSQFKKTRFNVRNFTAERVKMVRDTLSKNIFPEKGPLAKFSRKILKGNKKITSDTFKGISYKGPKFSLISNLTANPVVKAGFFFLDAYAAYSSGKQVINFKDNIGTALYDLGVSINNEIFKDDPSKLMLYRSESSNENIRVKQVIRNQKIRELKEQANNQSGNNVIVVPENKQENQVNSTIPIKKGGDEISFVPFEPLNSVGTDILLHKLNQ